MIVNSLSLSLSIYLSIYLSRPHLLPYTHTHTHTPRTIDRVVRAHHPPDIGLLHDRLKGRQEGLHEIRVGHRGVVLQPVLAHASGYLGGRGAPREVAL